MKERKVSPSSISDHELILVVLKVKRSPPKPPDSLSRSYKNYTPDAFLHDLSQVPRHVIETFEDVDGSLYAFHQLFEQILDQHAPIRKVKIRSRPNQIKAHGASIWPPDDIWSNWHAPAPLATAAASQGNFALGRIRGPS